jgi:copper chaperone CopZ
MKTTLSIAGMSCSHCVAAVTRALKDVPGVDVEQVTIGSATLVHDPARTPTDRLVDAVQDAGYDASVVASA